MTAVEIVA